MEKIRQIWTKWRLTRVVFAVSLGLNLIVGGMMIGAVLGGGPGEHMRGMRDASALGLRPYLRALDDNNRTVLFQTIAGQRHDFPIGQAQMTRHLKALAAAVALTPYDPDAVAAVMLAQEQVISGSVTRGQKILLDLLADMSPEQRADFAQALLRKRH